MMAESSLSEQLSAIKDLIQNGNLRQAEYQCEQLKLRYVNAHEVHYLLGLIHYRRKNYPAAVVSLGVAVDSEPENAGNRFGLAMALFQDQAYERSLSELNCLLDIKPKHLPGLCQKAECLISLKRIDAAVSTILDCLRQAPEYAPARALLRKILTRLSPHLALHHIRTAYEAMPADAEVNSLLRQTYLILNDYSAARMHAEQAIQADRNDADAYFDLAYVLQATGKQKQAEKALQRVLAINAEHMPGLLLSASLKEAVKDTKKAMQIYQRVLAIQPENPNALLGDFTIKQGLCQWDDLQAYQTVIQALRENLPKGTLPPQYFNRVIGSEKEQLANTVAFVHREFPYWQQSRPFARREKHHPMRVGFLSGDYGKHVMSSFFSSLMHLHDRNNFHFIACDFTPQDALDGKIRSHVFQGFDQIISLQGLSHVQAAEKIRSATLDILVDVAGYTRHARAGILALRPAPLQASWLAFTATTGAPWIDYLICDPVVIPKNKAQWYSESLTYLEHCFLPNNNYLLKRNLIPDCSEVIATSGVTYGCFCNKDKLNPVLLESWFRILRAVPDSVLWLLSYGKEAESNLRRYAVKSGIASDRLYFSPRTNLFAHLSRYRKVDICLDTLPFNGHATTADALWMEVPVITIRGDSFAGRGAASILEAAGIPELVMDSFDTYEELAIQLGHNSEMLSLYRDKIRDEKQNASFWNNRRYMQCFQSALTEIRDKGPAAPKGKTESRR